MHKPFGNKSLSVGGMTMCILRYIPRLYINEYSGAYSGEIKIETDFNMQNLIIQALCKFAMIYKT